MRRLRLAAAALAVTCAAAACGGPTRVHAPKGTVALTGDAWFEARMDQLAMSYDDARGRDRSMSDKKPPDVETLDSFVREQADAAWEQLCANCHGLDGTPPANTPYNPPPRAWGTFGTSMGFFFGGDDMRAGIYRKIAEGGKSMPAWQEMLSREQIWSLVYHIESL